MSLRLLTTYLLSRFLLLSFLLQIVYERIIPATGFMLFLGNVFYSYQAIRMTRKYKRPFTAQPYGINGAGGFPFVFGIIYGVFFSLAAPCLEEGATCTDEEILAEENYRIETAWQVCVTANFITVRALYLVYIYMCRVD